MHDRLWLRSLHRFWPGLVPGVRLHRAALAASAEGCWPEVPALVTAAAEAYRREMAVEPLARLRVHELMFAAREPGGEVREAELMQDIVRRVNRLDTLESLEAPFEPLDARVVLAHWVGESPVAAPLPLRLQPAA